VRRRGGNLRGDEPPSDPLQEWAVQEGYSLKITVKGFSLPTGIAVVPNPASDPKAPRMFVTELRGTIKAVANECFAGVVMMRGRRRNARTS
jgi:hypothetical protein